MNPHSQGQSDQLETGLLQGAAKAGVPVVGVEQSNTDPSSVGFFSGLATASVDDGDNVSGQVAMVFALLGADGNFGIKGGADRLLPDLLAPSTGR
jgi:hypothetical protein